MLHIFKWTLQTLPFSGDAERQQELRNNCMYRNIDRIDDENIRKGDGILPLVDPSLSRFLKSEQKHQIEREDADVDEEVGSLQPQPTWRSRRFQIDAEQTQPTDNWLQTLFKIHRTRFGIHSDWHFLIEWNTEIYSWAGRHLTTPFVFCYFSICQYNCLTYWFIDLFKSI